MRNCCICGKENKRIGIGRGVTCLDKECKIVYNMLAIHGTGSLPKNVVWHSYSSNRRWTSLPPKKTVLQKLKEVTAKNFLLEKLSEAEFLNKLQYGGFDYIFNKEYCKPSPLKFKTYEYKKQRRITDTR